MYTMIMGKVPFDGFSETEIFNNIINQPLMFKAALEKGKTTECIDLLKRSLYKVPDQRMTAMACMNHRWIKVYGRDSSEREALKECLKNFMDFMNKGPLQQILLRWVCANMVNRHELDTFKDIFFEMNFSMTGLLNRQELIENFWKNGYP